MKRNHKLFVKDILDCIEKIDEFMGSMDFQKFMEDDKCSNKKARDNG